MPVITKCAICDKEIKSSPSRIRKTCSKDCQKIYLSNIKDKGCKSVCQQCGTVFSHKPSTSPKFCSIKCKALSQEGKQEYKIDLNMNEIKRLYVEENKSAAAIGEIMGVNKKLILQRLHDMNIEMRTKAQGKSLFLQNNPEQNPNNLPGVKERQSSIQIELNKTNPGYARKRAEGVKHYYKNMTEEEKQTWKKNVSKGIINMSPEAIHNKMMKQFDTKMKNGTFNCTGIENKFAATLEEQGIEYIREYIIPEGTKRYRYDFYIPSEHMLVEINGTGTHADPEKYLAEDIIKLGIPGWKVRTAAEIWHEDEVKRVYAVKKGYNIKTVWEREL